MLRRDFTSVSSSPHVVASGPPFARAVAPLRPGRRRRIEVFSPKLGRRLTLGSYDAWRVWLALEANPAVTSFCERPAYVDGRGAVFDFWVQLPPHPSGEFWCIERPQHQGANADAETAAHTAAKNCPSTLLSLPVRVVAQVDLTAWAVPISNWARILPYLVSHRRFRDPLLEQSIVVYLGKSRALDDILARFAGHDAAAVEAAVYAVLAGGRIRCPELATSPLTGSTVFHRP